MIAPDFQFMDRFNRQVLVCQDEAFTLAFSILGDERLASNIVQEVILRVYHRRDDREDHIIPIKVLQGVILLCRQMKPSMMDSKTEWLPGWNQLERSEQETLLLVDVLDKSYQYTALVLNCSERDVARTVSHGRYKLADKVMPRNAPDRKLRRSE